MQNNARKSLVLFLVLIIPFGYGVLNLFRLRFHMGDVYPPYSSLRSDPLGTKALYEGLEELKGLTAIRNYRFLSRLETAEPVTLLVLGAAEFDPSFSHQTATRNLENIAASGGRLVIAFHPEEGVFRFEAKENAPQQKKDQQNKRRHAENDKPRTRPESIADRWGVESKVAGETGNQEAVSTGAEAAFPDLPAISWHTRRYFKNLDDAWKTIYLHGKHPVIIERKWGKGTIVLCADAYLFSNEALLKERHTELLSWFIGTNRRILFDESHLGIEKSIGIADLARQYRLHAVAAACALIAVLFIWKNTFPFSPVENKPDSMAGNHIAFSRGYREGMASLLRRNLPPQSLLTACLSEWEASFHTGRRSSSGLDEKLKSARILLETKQKRSANSKQLVPQYRKICNILAKRKNP